MMRAILIGIILNFSVLSISITSNASDVFEVAIVHFNDFHARFEETSNTSTACKGDPKHCIGGFSRVYNAINQLIKDRPNVIVLNAGDNFQGTLWYHIYKWNVTQHFLNLLPFDVYTLGNHEFDDGIQGLVPFLTSINAPFVAANIDDSEEPDIQGLYNKSVIIERNGKKIGVIGVVSESTPILSKSGKLRFLDESASVNQEAERLIEIENVDTIIVLSHCGYEADKKIARKASPKIGLIVGGHSHSFLYTGEEFPGVEQPTGPYPTIINHEDGRQILIVQASALTKFVGNISVQYNTDGNVISWSGAPIYLNQSIPQEEDISTQLQLWKEDLDLHGNRVLGYTDVLLQHDTCQYAECNLGNLISDVMLYSVSNIEDANLNKPTIAIMHSAGMRTSIYPRNITFNDVMLTLPFGNTFDFAEIQGRHLKSALEHGAGNEYDWGASRTNFLQMSGIRVVYNVSKPVGSRVESVKVRCIKCTLPLYEDLDVESYYRIAINAYLVQGGHGYVMLKNNVVNRKIGEVDVDALGKYLESHSPITHNLEGRIVVMQ